MQTRNWIGLATAVGAVAVAGGTYMRYRHDLDAKSQALEAKSEIAETKRGSIEYAREGSGPPALVIHGAGGGYDQGLYLAHEMLGDGFDVIAPSRFGYLRTPVPHNASHSDQADAHAALLDNWVHAKQLSWASPQARRAQSNLRSATPSGRPR